MADTPADGPEDRAPLAPDEAWAQLQDALVADFIDGLPIGIRTTDLAARLHVSRSSLMTNIRRGNVVADRRNGHWEIDVVASAGFLRSSILGIGERRRRSLPEDGAEPPHATVAITVHAAELLTEIMKDEQLSAADAVELALERLHDGDA
ncbi:MULTISPECIES: hypothetical protein [unclassified Plantibacter]|uniref:hypothetical protein n=1 Tax=unclassified Plantibacter TaxID=2624265 RepID=UPI003D33BBE9